MAFETENTVGAPGLLFPFVSNSIETGIMQEEKNSEGGFPVFGKQGEGDKVWATQSSSAEAVARVQKVAVTATSAEGAKKVSVSVSGKKVEITTTASDAAADVVGDLVTAINGDAALSAIVTASGSASPLVLTFNTAGAAANDLTVAVESADSGVTIALATEGNTAGADATTATYFKGIAQRTMCRDAYEVGDVVNVVKKGRIWVKALGQVVSGEPAYINDTNNGITATSDGATAIAGGSFKSNANDGELVQLEIA